MEKIAFKRKETIKHLNKLHQLLLSLALLGLEAHET
jgi:hypothetical protein